MKISNWGNYPVVEANLFYAEQVEQCASLFHKNGGIIPRGMGRSYGDSSLANNILSSLRLNRFIDFDNKRGIVTLEAGVSLKEIIETFLPRGWFLPVTPGTKFVTVGGAIASDVHGKNHHKEGTFTEHVKSLTLLTPDGKFLECSKNKNRELFQATCAGMGLTGLIVYARIQLKKVATSYIIQKTLCASNLDQIMDLFEKHKDYTYSVAWIDGMSRGKSLGRSVLFIGEHAQPDQVYPKITSDQILLGKNKKALNIPFYAPSFTLNRISLNLFNHLFYRSSKLKSESSIIGVNKFFYPLDWLDNWNRLYGTAGFVQYQFVLPLSQSRKGIRKILTFITDNRFNSFLGVLKLFGRENKNLLSFPMKGYNLALDFPVKPGLFSFLDDLDKMVMEYGGRIYLTKDARLTQRVFQNGYPLYKKFIEIKKSIDKKGLFSSRQSKRIGV